MAKKGNKKRSESKDSNQKHQVNNQKGNTTK